MRLRQPDIHELQRACQRASAILISAPFYSQEGLNWVRPSPGGHVEFWTRFNPRDWAIGVSDPPALLRYLENVGEERVSLRVHRALHAKIYQVDTTWSWIGSPNLSRAAFTSNIELVAELEAHEIESLRQIVSDFRSSLKELSVPTFRDYIEACKDTIPKEGPGVWESDNFQAAVDMADEYLSPPPALDRTAPIPPLSDFIEFIDPMDREVPQTISDHHHNLSGQNRQGHVKQSYYGLVHFLSDSTQGGEYLPELVAIPLDDYPRFSLSFVKAWGRFLDHNARTHDSDLGYSFSTLRNILPERMGGYVTHGGGAIGTFTRMVPLVARFLSR